MTKHGRRILLKTRGFLGRLVAAFAGAVMLLTNVPAVNADNADKRDRITESAEKVCQWQRDKMGISQDESIFSGNFLQNAGIGSSDWLACKITCEAVLLEKTLYNVNACVTLVYCHL
jgi:hypothetical protein